METKNFNKGTRDLLFKLFHLMDITLELTQEKGSDIEICNAIYTCLYNSKNVPQFNIIVNMIFMTGYQDLYLKLKNKKNNNALSLKEKNMFKVLEEIETCEDLVKIPVKNINIMPHMIKAMIEFSRANVFEKIATIKLVDKVTDEKLSKINTVYYQDKENYDIDISLDYVINKIQQGKKQFSEEMVIYQAAYFIKQLLDIDDENAKVILDELIGDEPLSLDESEKNIRVFKIADLLESYIKKDKKLNKKMQ